MAKVVGGMTLSLDGFYSDAAGDIGRLYPDLAAMDRSEMMREEIRNTGAVVMGRKSYDMANPDSFADSYEYQVPIFVLTHRVPAKMPKMNARLTVSFVTDGIQTAMARARAAAGERNVVLIGGSANRQCLEAGLVDELHIGLMPVLLGDGPRFFTPGDAARLQLEKSRLFEDGERTDLWYRVVR